MAGSLKTSLKNNFSDNQYFVLVTGNVLRREILELEHLSDHPHADNDLVVQNSLEHRISQHLSDIGQIQQAV